MPTLAELQYDPRAEMQHQPFTPPNLPGREALMEWGRGVKERTLHPLEALAGAAQRTMDDPTAAALDWSSPMAGSLSGLAGIFAGKGAKTADLAKLLRAEELAKAGVPDAQIWKETGWTFGFPDKMPRFEIPDVEANVRNLPIKQSWEDYSRDIQLPQKASAKQFKEFKKKLSERETIYNTLNRTMRPVGDIYSHPQIYSEYPELSNLSAHYRPELGLGGSYGGGKIAFGDVSNLEGVKSLFGHELQHAIQQREGFARGGSPDTFAKEKFSIKRDIEDQITAINEAMTRAQGTPKYGELMDLRSELVRDLDKQGLRDSIGIQESSHNQYQRLAGEAEARLTQARMNMTSEQRLHSYPYQPEYFQRETGVPFSDLIVRKDGGTAMSTPEPLFNTIGLPNRGRELIQSKAEEYAQKLRNSGVNVIDVHHSGSAAGPSSYIKIQGYPDIRISGHSKGVFGTQGVVNVGNDAAFEDVLAKIPKISRKLSIEETARMLAKQKEEEIATMYPIRIKSAQKKLAKGKALTNSEQEAIDWMNQQSDLIVRQQ